MFASTAFASPAANTTAAAGEPSILAGAAPMLLILAVMYFLLIRPNQKRISDHQTMTKALRKGDRVVTGGGVIGVIYKLEGDDILVLEVAEDVRIKVMRDTISHVLSKPVAGDNDNKTDTAA